MRGATSRSTRWPGGWRTASSSTRSAVAPTSKGGVLRTVSARSFAEDPLRLVRGLRFVSQLGLDPDEATLRADARGGRGSVRARLGRADRRRARGGRHGRALEAPPRPRAAKALRLARDTGVLVALLPEFGPAIGFDPRSPDHGLTLDEHTFAVVQAAADAGTPLRVRLAALLHDLGKPVAAAGDDHAELGARLAAASAAAAALPERSRGSGWSGSSASTRSTSAPGDALEARRLLARHGEGLTLDLLDHWHADLPRPRPARAKRARLERLRARSVSVVEQERGSPHRLADLAVDGTDLIELGYKPGPGARPRARASCSTRSSTTPALNRRETLLARAEELLHA